MKRFLINSLVLLACLAVSVLMVFGLWFVCYLGMTH